MAGNGKARRHFLNSRFRSPFDTPRVQNGGETRRELTRVEEGGEEGARVAWSFGLVAVRAALREQPLRAKAEVEREHKGAEGPGTRLK
jgi:hypothetical protein